MSRIRLRYTWLVESPVARGGVATRPYRTNKRVAWPPGAVKAINFSPFYVRHETYIIMLLVINLPVILVLRGEHFLPFAQIFLLLKRVNVRPVTMHQRNPLLVLEHTYVLPLGLRR